MITVLLYVPHVPVPNISMNNPHPEHEELHKLGQLHLQWQVTVVEGGRNINNIFIYIYHVSRLIIMTVTEMQHALMINPHCETFRGHLLVLHSA